LKRRQFITLLGGAAMAWPLAARAQRGEHLRRIGWLIARAESLSQAERAAFQEALAKLGWTEGRNLRIDVRFAADDPDHIRAYAMELVGLAPDVIVTGAAVATKAVQQQTQTIPIVFIGGGDPVAIGLVRNIERPEGNTTGFSAPEPSIAGKYLGLLKEAAPGVSRVAIVFNPEVAPTAPSYISLIEELAPALGIRAIKMPFRNAIDIVRAIDSFAVEPSGGLVILPPPNTTAVRETIVPLAAQHRLPAIYPGAGDVATGGLLAYTADQVDRHRGAATYVERLLRGAKVADLPVQFPTKLELIINLKTAKAIGLTIPEALLLRADKVIE
jgi:putative tryptophan/tyrosine transport system substrate-binding protein